MPGTKTNLINYSEVLSELEQAGPNHLLLGNGFNLSLGVRTDYKSILNRMVENNREYKSVVIDDFDLEKFIGTCKGFIQKTGNKYVDFMEKFYQNRIKLDFMKAVTQIVKKEIKKIVQVEKDEIYLLLKNFNNYFTLNYDPFLYQLLMSYKKEDISETLGYRDTLPFIKEQLESDAQAILKEIEEGYNSGTSTIKLASEPAHFDLNKLSVTKFKSGMELYFRNRVQTKELNKIIDIFLKNKDLNEKREIKNIDDGFGLFNGELIYKNHRTQNLIFLHGAFHIYEKNKLILKVTREEENALYNKIEEIVENADENVICIFQEKDKETEIMQNEYLRNGLEKLVNLEGTMVIIGSSLADNDSHIFERINQSDVQRIFIASSVGKKNKDFKQAKHFWPLKDIILFDRETITYAK